MHSDTQKRVEVEVYRSLTASRNRRNLLRPTHIIVGDHEPERRVNHDPCEVGDGSTVAQCRGAACKAHNRCCWQP